jgi:hypothetical protein
MNALSDNNYENIYIHLFKHKYGPWALAVKQGFSKNNSQYENCRTLGSHTYIL